MNMTPWFHRGGLHSGGPTATLYAGASLVVMRMFGAKACFDAVGRYGVTFLIGVPSALEKAGGPAGKASRRSQRAAASSQWAVRSNESCIRFQRLLTPRIFNGYGTTETFWNSFLRPDDLPQMAGSAGLWACTDDEVRVVALHEGRDASPDETVPHRR